jgi:hypothetical protein
MTPGEEAWSSASAPSPPSLARYFFKHPIDCADVEVNVFVQAGAKSVDEGDGADLQRCLVWVLRARAASLKFLPPKAEFLLSNDLQ